MSDITFYTIARPFTSVYDVIQRNAIRSWQQYTDDVIVIADQGAPVPDDLGVRTAECKRSKAGVTFFDDVVLVSEGLARYETLCVVSCDVMLLPFVDIVQAMQAQHDAFLLLTPRTNIPQPGVFEFGAGWDERLRQYADQYGKPSRLHGGDVFIYRYREGGLWSTMPPFLTGRDRYDKWMITHALETLGPDHVRAIRDRVIALHQDHPVRIGMTTKERDYNFSLCDEELKDSRDVKSWRSG